MIMKTLPSRFKRWIYRRLLSLGASRSWCIHPAVHRLPFGLALKTSARETSINETAALRFLEASKTANLNFPFLVDSTTDGTITYMLSTYIDGDCACEVMEGFSSQDWRRLELDLRGQLTSLHIQTSSHHHNICSAAGGIIDDPRMSWVAEGALELATTQDFFAQVWLGLDFPWNRETIRPAIQPLIDRPVPVAPCHGDVYPRNIIFPGGVEAWRVGKTRLCLIDWEFSGWMPAPWEAPKATFIEAEPDSEWQIVIRHALPEFREYLDADWLWRSKSRMMII
ncbi:hypothetical protein EST38_g12111 [Candolleomyces aberdarensis]|uniref:Uncharacterized protein n=1 Tax=Candolleomyces aberdarensis TaxID=2316362 RepID=A0A4Q2D5U1_9AGAR|nr:hypothetical protein EST38_g12111 [Candolleomyces aberdarensis]